MRTERATQSVKAKKTSKKALDPMNATVASIMTRKVQSVRPDTSLDVAMELLMSKDISHLPVIDDERKLVGILSKTDLVRERFMNGSNVEGENVRFGSRRGVSYSPGAGFHEDPDVSRLVSDIMSSKVRAVNSTSTVAEAAIAMAKYRVHGLPVVNDDKDLVGFVSTLDIVGWVAAS